jgi:hypothetical protein
MTFMAVAALAVVLAFTAPSQAAGVGGHGFEGHPGGSFGSHHFDGHHFDGRHFDGRHFDRRFGVGPVFPYVYGYAPGYWYYYCPSYGAYYPNVTSCPETWVPFLAS